MGDFRSYNESLTFYFQAIFDFTNEKGKERSPRASVWFQTVKGLLIALCGAGMSYGLQSVFVKQLSLQPTPIMSMETLLFRSVFQVIVFFPTAMIRNVHIIPPQGKKIPDSRIPQPELVAAAHFGSQNSDPDFGPWPARL